MKILYYFRNEGTYMYTWQIEQIVDELYTHNCFIKIINPLDYNSLDEANNAVLQYIKSGDYQLFMTCLNEKYLYNDTIKLIKRFGVPTLLFCPDNLLSPYINEHNAFLFDLVWLTSKETEYIYKKWGCNTMFLPYASNPMLFSPNYSEEWLRIGFIGNPHGSRSDRINFLTSNGIPVTVHCKKADSTIKQSGSDRKKIKPVMSLSQNILNYLRYPIGRRLLLGSIVDKTKKHGINLNNKFISIENQVPFNLMGKVISSYALMLSFSEAKSTGVLKKTVPIINLRQFEIPMAGGLQFTMYNEELAEYFENGKEIIMCQSNEEYIEKSNYYLQPDKKDERLRIKVAARLRAESEHSWYSRFKKLFEKMGIINNISF